MKYKVSGAIAIPKASWGCASALPNRIQVVFLGENFSQRNRSFPSGKRGFHPCFCLPACCNCPVALLEPVILILIIQLCLNWKVSKNAIAAGIPNLKIKFASQTWATRPHLGSIFEKLLHRKTFRCLRLVFLKRCSQKNQLRTGRQGWGISPACLEIAIAPETLYSHYNLSIFKAITICGSLLDFRFISLYSFICFANVGCSPTPRQHF